MTTDGPDAALRNVGFLEPPPTTPEVQALYDQDIEGQGFVMNNSVLWAHHPQLHDDLAALIGRAAEAAALTFRQRGILITAAASTLGDSYCSLAWGRRLAKEAGEDVAAGVLDGSDHHLDTQDAALAGWARRVTRDPNATVPSDVQPLRDAGFTDAQIFAITVFIALRIAFSSVNDALGALPDIELARTVPDAVREAVTFGRPVGSATT